MAQRRKIQVHPAETGMILIRDNALLPLNLSLNCTPFTPGWKVIENLDSHAFSRKIKDKNWRFVRLDTQRNVRVLGLATQRTLRRGVNRILDGLKGRRFNSLEITVVVFKWFLGITYLGISANLRHVQDNAA